MARHPFFGTADAVLQDEAGNAISSRDESNVLVRPITCWTSKTGGTQITDLTTEGAVAIPGGTLDAVGGRIPRVLGPDGRNDMWVNTGLGDRFLVNTTDVPGRVSTLETTVSGLANNSTALNALTSRVTTAETDITGVKTVNTTQNTTLGTHTTQITGLTTRMTTAESNITDLQNASPGTGGGTQTQFPATAVVYSSTFRGARPATNAGQYTWTCDGSGDQAEINAAITAVNSDGGGRVLLLGANFYVNDSILLRTNVELDCAMAIIEASTDFEDGVIGLFDTAVHRTSLVNFNIDGNGKRVHGISYIGGNTGNAGQVFTSAPATNPDPSHTIRNGNIYSVGSGTWAGHGMHMYGGNLRAGKYSDIRILGASGCGVFANLTVDSHWTNIEVGSSGGNGVAVSNSATAPVGHGFFINSGDNNMFTACKSWFSDATGFYLRANRCGFVNCQAQDNRSNGFETAYGKSSFVGCHADSNGQDLGVGGKGRDGFKLTTENNIVDGCFSYDRGRGWQQYGFRFSSGFTYSVVSGCKTYGNIMGSQTGTPGTGTPAVQIVADADGK